MTFKASLEFFGKTILFFIQYEQVNNLVLLVDWDRRSRATFTDF